MRALRSGAPPRMVSGRVFVEGARDDADRGAVRTPWIEAPSMRSTQASALWKWTLTMVLPDAARGVGDALLDVPADDGGAAGLVRRWMAGR